MSIKNRNFTPMNMLKKLRGIFIEDVDEDNDNRQGSSAASSIKKSSSKKNRSPIDSESNRPKGGAPDDRFVGILLKAIEDNNIEGFDYLEFKQSLQSLAKIESDESKRYVNAFAMATTMGLTKDKLLKSAQHYIKVLEKEEAKFADAFKKQQSVQIKKREEKGKMLRDSIAKKEKEVLRLQKEIKKEQEQLLGIDQNIDKAMNKVEGTKEGFYGSYNLVLNQIKSDLDKIKQYLS